MEVVVVFILIVGILLAGVVCGISALVRVLAQGRQLEGLRLQLRRLEKRVKELASPEIDKAVQPEAEEPEPQPPERPPEPVPAARVTPPPMRTFVEPPPPVEQPPVLEPSPAVSEEVPEPAKPFGIPSLEVTLGTKWLGWVGIVMVLMGVGFFLKYAYDNNWIGPVGRLTLGAFAGIAAVIAGERFRRRDWQPLFQTLTGGGIAIFYICVFFSFQIYELSGQGLSFVLAILVTAFAVTIAVAHDKVSIAVIALIGGFLSPAVLYSGTNHPYILFSYVAVLDLVAIGAAYFRRWRTIDLLCLVGTALMYQGWYTEFYKTDQITPALIYTTVFYLMFLIIPLLHGLVRRLPEEVIGLVIVVLNAVFSFYCYYNVLFHDYRQVMGFVALGQALLVFMLFRTWTVRVGKDRTAESLLIVTLALVTIAIPIHLKLYAVTLAWAIEGALFVYLGIKFDRLICRVGGVAALALAGIKLLTLMPLHSELFVPVLNTHFGSWLVVIAAAAVAAYLLWHNNKQTKHWDTGLSLIAFLMGFVLGCIVLTAEVSQYWSIPRVQHWRNYTFDSLVILWSLIPAVTAWAVHRKKMAYVMALPWACYVAGATVFLLSLDAYRLPSTWLVLNYTFLSRLVFVLSLWWGARLSRHAGTETAGNVLETVGHVMLVVLAAVEILRWGNYSEFVTDRLAISLISAAWALHALALIWIGLITKNRVRRILGFVLFGVTVFKILAIDMNTLEKAYRIISFIASGLLLLAAARFYHQYSPMLLEEDGHEEAA